MISDKIDKFKYFCLFCFIKLDLGSLIFLMLIFKNKREIKGIITKLIFNRPAIEPKKTLNGKCLNRTDPGVKWNIIFLSNG
jgi:hypothetical protein